MRAITSVDVPNVIVSDAATCLAATGSATTPCLVMVKGTTLETPRHNLRVEGEFDDRGQQDKTRFTAGERGEFHRAVSVGSGPNRLIPIPDHFGALPLENELIAF